MTSGQHAVRRSVGDRSPRSRPGAAGGDRSRPEASPWEGEGYRKVWARLRACRDIRVARKRVLRLMRGTICSRPIAAAAVAQSAMTPRSSLDAPNSHVGHRSRSCSRWTTAGAGSSPPSTIGTPSSVGWHARRPRRRPAADLRWGCRAVWLDRRPRGSAAPCGWITAPSCRTGPTRSMGIQPSRLRRRAPTNGVAERSHAEGNPWSHRATSRSCGTRRDFVELYAQWIVEKNGYRALLKLAGVARRDSIRPAAQLVSGGCATSFRVPAATERSGVEDPRSGLAQ